MSTVAAPEAAEVPELDIDREAFELAQRARDGTADTRTAAAGRALLVCSPGGHLAQMLALEPAWRELETTWVTLPGADVEYLLAGQDVVLGRGPTNRSLKNLVRNLRIAWRTVRDSRPDVILSTGAALAVPFFLVGRLHGCRCVYIESFTRVEGLSFSGRMVYPLANTFFVQWPSLTERFPKAVYVGSVI
jgi:UDP-N-acetylglucosamine:LPS N-acetylglucosamine transferase